MDSTLEQARRDFIEGIEHFEQGRLDQARASFESSLALAPGRPSVLGNLGITLFRLGQWREAARVLAQATSAEPANADTWFCLGLSEQALERWTAAADALARGLALQPKRLDLWLVLGQCLLRSGQAAQALQAYDRALAVDPAFAPAWSERGNLLRELHRLDEAAECFRTAISLGGDAELNGFYLASVRGSGPSAPPRRYVEALFDDYAADFQSHLVEQLNYRGHEVLVRPLLQAGRTFGDVLDLGCGTGLCGSLIRPVAGAIDGIDVSGAMIEQARKSGHYRELHHADLAGFLAESARSYDLVLAADVFVYVGELCGVFESVRRILRPHGCFAFTFELAVDGQDVSLLPSLRYAHSQAYVRRLAQAHGFDVGGLFEAPIRHDQRKPVQGAFVYLRHASG